MGKEIERKFLVKSGNFKENAQKEHIHQGFLSTEKERVVRVRIMGDEAYLTIKGLSEGITRKEFEYRIPLDDARILLKELCKKPTIEKFRYRVEHGGLTWEVDEFLGANEGLVVAEVELEDPDQEVSLPAWAGREVSGDPRYFNSNLVKDPYKNWK